MSRVSGSYICATGGTFTTDIDGYKYHIYSNAGSFSFNMTCNPLNDTIEVLVVGGGENGFSGRGGGGAGGVVNNRYVALPTGSYTMTVGNIGLDSTFAASSAYSITAYGGASGRGGNIPNGAGEIAPYPSQGNDGGNALVTAGGGGGGASEVGKVGQDTAPSTGGNGGDGIYLPQFAILNTVFPYYPNDPSAPVSYFFGGYPDGWYGGGGSGIAPAQYGNGGAGGGAFRNSPRFRYYDVMDALHNTGGAGAGGIPPGNRVGNGSRGMIIIRYRFSPV